MPFPEPADPDLSVPVIPCELDLPEATLEDLTNWLLANDPNGCYTPEDRGLEGLPRMSLEEALGHYRLQTGFKDVHPADLRVLLNEPRITDAHMLVFDSETGRYVVWQFVESLPPEDHIDLLTIYALANRPLDWEHGLNTEFTDRELVRVAHRLNESEIPDC